MEKITLSQLLEKQQTLAAKVIALQEVEDFKKNVTIKTEVDSEDYFDLRVEYGSSWRGDLIQWGANKKDYGEDQEIHDDAEAYDAMMKAVDEALAKAEARANSIIARIAAIIKK